MHITLSEHDCKMLFAAHHYAHLGCIDGQDPYVVPVTYLYHDSSFYSFTQEGKKIEIMRKHPNVCLQVEQVENGFIWQSAIAWGAFEEVEDEKEAQAMKVLLAQQFGKITLKERQIPVSPMINDLHARTGIEIGRSIIFRIRPVKMTGKGSNVS